MQTLQCQICDHETRAERFAFEQEQGMIEDWCLHIVPVCGGSVQVLCCPMCSHMDVDSVFEGYKRRIREGRDIRYQ